MRKVFISLALVLVGVVSFVPSSFAVFGNFECSVQFLGNCDVDSCGDLGADYWWEGDRCVLLENAPYEWAYDSITTDTGVEIGWFNNRNVITKDDIFNISHNRKLYLLNG